MFEIFEFGQIRNRRILDKLDKLESVLNIPSPPFWSPIKTYWPFEQKSSEFILKLRIKFQKMKKFRVGGTVMLGEEIFPNINEIILVIPYKP